MPRELKYNYVKSVFESRNYKLISNEYINSKTKLRYICPNGHEGSITFSAFRAGKGCMQCANISKSFNSDRLRALSRKRAKKYEDVKAEFEKYGFELLTKEYTNNLTKLEYICPNGHRGTTTYKSFSKLHSCRKCAYATRKVSRIPNKKTIEDIREEFSKRGYKLLTDTYENNKQKLEFVCPKGHKHSITYNSFSLGHGCRICSQIENSKRISQYSKQETEIAEFLADKLDIIRHDRTIIPPFELDIVIPSKKMAIEYCGLYWHTEGMGKDKNYHLNKLNMCENAGYRLITIFEDEWKYKKDIVKSRLKHILGISDCERVFARKCKIREIDNKTKNEFLERNHLLGKDVSSIRLGAFYGDRLVSVMTFSRGSVAKNNINPDSYELVRFCSDIDLHVVGIASKLLKYFKKNYFDGKIFSYSDKRWSDGGLYKSLGFEKYGDVSPNYWYVVGDTRAHRFNFRKSALKEKLNAFNDVLTEYENMFLNGFDRVWDCGNIKWA